MTFPVQARSSSQRSHVPRRWVILRNEPNSQNRTLPLSKRRKPSMVTRQNRSLASVVDGSIPAGCGTCCGCWSHVNASQTLISIKYEVIGGLGFRASRPRLALPLEQRHCHALALAHRVYRGHAGNGLAAFGDDDSLLGQILQQREALAAELGNAEVSHNQSVRRDVQPREAVIPILLCQANDQALKLQRLRGRSDRGWCSAYVLGRSNFRASRSPFVAVRNVLGARIERTDK